MRLAYIGIPWRLIIDACRGLPPIQRKQPTSGETMNTSDHFDDECPTMRVEVPCIRQQPQPVDGYGFHARAPHDTDISDIPADEWNIEVLDAPPSTKPLMYQGRVTIDDMPCHVWWVGETEGFIAQSVNAC